MRLLARSFTLLGRWAPVLVGSLLIDMAVASGAQAQTGVGAVYAVTYLDVAATSVTQGIALLKKYRELSRHEAGNLEFTVLEETIRPNRFVIFEGWKDQAAFDAHTKAASSSKFQEALTPIRNSPPYLDDAVRLCYRSGAGQACPRRALHGGAYGFQVFIRQYRPILGQGARRSYPEGGGCDSLRCLSLGRPPLRDRGRMAE